MIGAFARMTGGRDRPRPLIPEVHDADGEPDAREAPPEEFVEPYPHEGGTVFIVPLLDHLREVLRKARGGKGGTVSRVSQKAENGSRRRRSDDRARS